MISTQSKRSPTEAISNRKWTIRAISGASTKVIATYSELSLNHFLDFFHKTKPTFSWFLVQHFQPMRDQ